MGKLYIFGIGGTGSRVLKSLTMLLASGVKCGVDTIVPIIIDPDDSAADLTRTVESMRRYSEVRTSLTFSNANKSRFFYTKIEQTLQNYRLPLKNTRDIKFKEYMSVSTMSKANEALINMLFSQKNLESNMKVGFKGNPNIGSVVLNQFSDSQEFRSFANDFQQDDKIFIISSIFGGTGASGFPLLAKTLRSDDSIPNYALVNKAQIGAISVLPYFGVKQDDSSDIDSGTFISKTKSALSYYLENISENNTVDSLYYIADDIHNQYNNCEGGSGQKNNAHIIELISALAIIDFSFSTYQGETIHKEFGLEKESLEVIFEDFGGETRSLIQGPLTQFLLFCNYFRQVSSTIYESQTWAKDGKCDSAFFHSQFVKAVRTFQNDFIEWLGEMDDNKRKLSLFELANTSKAFHIVKGKEPKKLLNLSSDYSLFDNFLNKHKENTPPNKNQYFVELFYAATKELIGKKFNF